MTAYVGVSIPIPPRHAFYLTCEHMAPDKEFRLSPGKVSDEIRTEPQALAAWLPMATRNVRWLWQHHRRCACEFSEEQAEAALRAFYDLGEEG